jgi:folate-binding Fe-S cluster repair protein YgfZ
MASSECSAKAAEAHGGMHRGATAEARAAVRQDRIGRRCGRLTSDLDGSRRRRRQLDPDIREDRPVAAAAGAWRAARLRAGYDRSDAPRRSALPGRREPEDGSASRSIGR